MYARSLHLEAVVRVIYSAGKQHDALKKKKHGQDPGKHIEVINQYQIADL
jgi:hypothetical protein